MKTRDLQKFASNVYKQENELHDRINKILELYDEVRYELDPTEIKPVRRVHHIDWFSTGWLEDVLWVVTDDRGTESIPWKLLNKSANLEDYRKEMIANVLEERRSKMERAKEERLRVFLELSKEFGHGCEKSGRDSR